MRELEDYECDSIADVLKEFRYRCSHDPDMVEEIDSVLALLEEEETDE